MFTIVVLTTKGVHLLFKLPGRSAADVMRAAPKSQTFVCSKLHILLPLWPLLGLFQDWLVHQLRASALGSSEVLADACALLVNQHSPMGCP